MSAAQGITEQGVRERSRGLGEPAWLLEDRLQALKRFEGLAVESNPLFVRHTEAPKALEPGDGTAKPTLTGPARAGVAFRELGADDAEAHRAELTNGLGGFEHDKFSNLPRALFGTGALLHVAEGVEVDEPFAVRYEARGGAAYARNLLVLERGARATLLLETAGDQGPATLGLTAEALLGPGAELRLLGVDTSGAEHTTLLTTQGLTGPDAALEVHHAFLGGALARARTDIALQGRGSRVRQSEVVFGRGQQRFDLTTNIAHQGPDTTSDALCKAVLRDAARANIKGIIALLQEGKNADSFLAQHAMLLSKQARCIAIPSLEIINREIKRAKHAATVSQVDENQVFYLQTRGLSDPEARKAIVLGFLGPLLERLGEAAGERVRADIEAKWDAR